MRNIDVDHDKALAAATSGYLNATELADYLVRKGMPFREAHEVVGQIVRRAIELDKELDQLPVEELRAFSALFAEDVHIALSLDQTLRSKSQAGGTAPEQVAAALQTARQSL